MKQEVRFTTAADGVRIAYATHGKGPPLVKAANWLTHLEFDWDSPVWRHWLHELARGHTVIRYDERGCGLSDRDAEDLSADAWLSDLEAVIEAAGLERFALLGISQGGPIAIAYAVKHPERVSHLVLYGAYPRGLLASSSPPEWAERAEMLNALIRVGWGQDNPAFRQVFGQLFVPGGSPEQMDWFEELTRTSTSPQMAERLARAWNELDVTELLGKVSTPTLVAHTRDDAMVPFVEGRRLATAIPNARFLPLDSANHLLLEEEPAWAAFTAEMRDFVGASEQPPAADDDLADLSNRELEVLTLVADGLANDEIARRLFLSSRTVERHLANIYVKLRISGKAARAAAAARYSRLRG